jgi:hypothetical protein
VEGDQRRQCHKRGHGAREEGGGPCIRWVVSHDESDQVVYKTSWVGECMGMGVFQGMRLVVMTRRPAEPISHFW